MCILSDVNGQVKCASPIQHPAGLRNAQVPGPSIVRPRDCGLPGSPSVTPPPSAELAVPNNGNGDCYRGRSDQADQTPNIFIDRLDCGCLHRIASHAPVEQSALFFELVLEDKCVFFRKKLRAAQNAALPTRIALTTLRYLRVVQHILSALNFSLFSIAKDWHEACHARSTALREAGGSDD